MLRVGVELPRVIDDAGEYLANVTALEAAGADTIWVDDTGLDPWVLLGAMAAVTIRARLGCLLTSTERRPSSRLGAAAATLQRLSRGRLVIAIPPQGRQRSRVAALRTAGATTVYISGSMEKTADGVILTVQSADQLSEVGGSAGQEVWASIAIPADREGWASALSAYEAAGASGVIVPWKDRLVDLLRNPEPDDRTDLLIATG